MDSASIAARSGVAPTITQIVKWETADFTIRWAAGGYIVWGSEVFVSNDLTYGTLNDMPTFSDGVDSQNTRADFTILPASQEALAAMANRKHQNTLIRAWDVDVDPQTGLMIGTPDPLFRGEADFVRLIAGDRLEIVLECGTEEARLNSPNEDRRLSAPHHRSVWPGEAGLDFVTGLGRKIYWRQSQPSSVSGGGGYVGGGGGGEVNSY